MLYRPKISIITASYNRGDTIEQTIASVVNQTYDNIEYIVIDGGSTDGTVNLLKKYDEHIAYWCSEPDDGIYDAFNKGTLVATGDYVQFIGADDCLHDNDCIAKVAQILANAPDVDLLSTDVVCIDEKIHLEHNAGHVITHFAGLTFRWMQHGGVFARTALMRMKSFDTKYRIGADYKFLLECVRDKRNIQYSDLPTVYFAESGISSAQKKQAAQENIQILKDFGVPSPTGREANSAVQRAKQCIKGFMRLVGAYELYLRWRHHYRPHTCKNPICRWCGRA